MIPMTSFLDQHISKLLQTIPFKDWHARRTVDHDFEQQIVSYIFEGNGLVVLCDGNDHVSTIFMYAGKHGGFDESLLDFSFTHSREHVLAHLGAPSKSGARKKHPILGECGAWDRFDYAEPDLSAHFEYTMDENGISRFTLMRGDVVPNRRN